MANQEPTFPPTRFEQKDFFVPGTETAEDAHRQWNWLAARLGLACTERKVQRLAFKSNNNDFVAEVGHYIHDGSGLWLVSGIFEPYGTSRSDPWAIMMFQIRKGEIAFREPAWQVAQGTVEQAFDFRQPEEKPGI